MKDREMGERDYGLWAPWPLERIVARFRVAPFRYWLSGGLALELWMGRSWRAHDDVDLGLLREDTVLAQELLDDCELFVAAAGTLSRYTGQNLTAGKHQNNVWARERSSGLWVVDLTLNDGDGDMWIYRRDPSIRRPWTEAVLQTLPGPPYLAPELQLLCKSWSLRPKDTVDAEIVIPELSRHQRRFLANALPTDHSWQVLVACSG
jgi:hypothetical protein